MAVARKLVTAVWHLLKGHWNQAFEETTTLTTKLYKLATELGVPVLKDLGYESKAQFQEKKLYHPEDHSMKPKSQPASGADGEPPKRRRKSGEPSRFPQTPSSKGNMGSAPSNTPEEPTQKREETYT